jgi:hypothetical protein
VISLTHTGRQEAGRRQSELEEAEEPIVFTRDELVAKLRELGLTDEQMAFNPALRHDRFHFWPSIPAWASAPDDS